MHWPATGFDHDSGNTRHLVVTVDTLDMVLAAAENLTGSLRGVDAVPGGVVHVHGRDGITIIVTPDRAGWYHLRTRGWPFVCEPDPT
jgi:hypothetical protein